MTSASVFHFLHILVFAVIAGIELPAMYALRLARAPDSGEVTRTLAVRVKRYSDAISAIMLVLLLPLGVQVATHLGVYALMSPGWLYATWGCGIRLAGHCRVVRSNGHLKIGATHLQDRVCAAHHHRPRPPL